MAKSEVASVSDDLALGLQGSNASMSVRQVESAAAVQAEIVAQLMAAKRWPRDETGAATKAFRSAESPAFCRENRAMYSFPRGGERATGLSINSAKELKRCWGNIRSGTKILEQTDEEVHVQGYAIDLETNATATYEDRFKKLIYRKKGGWVRPDERDLRELVNRRGAILERNAILAVLPPHVCDTMLQKIETTKRKLAAGDLKGEDRQQTLLKLSSGFDKFGVDVGMLEAYLGHALDKITAEELADLRGVFGSMRDGHTKREDHFTIPGTEIDGDQEADDEKDPLDDFLAKNQKEKK